MNRYKVVIIEDDKDITTFLADKISQSCDYSVLKTYENPQLFLDDVTLEFDIILLDIIMPVMNGIDAIQPILSKYPDAAIVINSIMDDVDTVYAALKKGVLGYIDKQYFDTNYEEVFNIVINGGAYMTPKIARKVVSSFNKPTEGLEMLTSRELEIADHIINGLSYKLIASQLEISLDTVRVHIKSIYRKLKINSKGELFSIVNKRFYLNALKKFRRFKKILFVDNKRKMRRREIQFYP